MDSSLEFPPFKWPDFGTDDYFKAIDEINDVYRKKEKIIKVKKVFSDQACPMMMDKTKDEFNKAQRRLNDKY